MEYPQRNLRKRKELVINKIAIAIAVAVAMLLASFGAMVATDRPQFCASCHEMRPYYDAWQQGPHKNMWCIDCHVGPSAAERIMHKFAALKQVEAHITGGTTFPLPTPPEVPTARCIHCHPKLPTAVTWGFPHSAHAKDQCSKCHATAGHSVGAEALQTAGVYAEGSNQPEAVAHMVAEMGSTATTIEGHKTVRCSFCHDMSNMACSACHTPRHKNNADRGTACDNCHKPGARFVFTHPTGQMCTDCHTLPLTHKMLRSDATPNCGTCHIRPGVAWIARHPYPSANCKQCHTRPSKNHPTTSDQCSLCHTNVGGAFSFNHPVMTCPHAIGTFQCVQCHPSNYTTHSCTCHKAALEPQYH